jgi:hypothetical protein
MDAATLLPDFDEVHRELEEARGAMCTAIEARKKTDIVQIFVRVRHIHAQAAGSETYFADAHNTEFRRSGREVRLAAEYLMGQWLIKLEEMQLRYTGRPGKGVRIGTPPDPSLITLDDLGVSRIESQLWQVVAKLSPEEYAALVADDTATSALLRQFPESRSAQGSKVHDLKFHRLADIFPLMEGPKFDALAADIKANGLRETIVLFEEKILDGRNRWHACKKAGVEPKTKEYRGKDPLAFVISMNLQRRHLDESQRAMVAARLATTRHGENQDPSGKFAARSDVPTQAEAAGLLNVSERTVRGARKVIEHGTDELKHAVDRGEVSVSAAAEVATQPVEEQRELVARGEKEIPAAASKIRARKREQKPPRPDPAAKPVGPESMGSDNDAQDLAPAATPDLLDAATDRATADDVYVLDADLPTYFGPSRRQLTLDERLGNLISLTEETIFAFVPAMRAAGRLPELFRRVRKSIDKLEAEAAADGDQTEDCAESAAIEHATPTQEERPPSPAAKGR